MTTAEFEPPIPVIQLPQTHALDRSATGIGMLIFYYNMLCIISILCTDIDVILLSY